MPSESPGMSQESQIDDGDNAGVHEEVTLPSQDDSHGAARATSPQDVMGPELINDNTRPSDDDVVQIASMLERSADKGMEAGKQQVARLEHVDAGDGEEPLHPSSLDDSLAKKRAANDREVTHQSEHGEPAPAELVPPSPSIPAEFNHREDEENQHLSSQDVNDNTPTQQHGARQNHVNLVEEKVEDDVSIPGSTRSHNIERGDLPILRAWPVPPHDGGGEIIPSHGVRLIVPWWEQSQNKLYTWALLCFFATIALAAYETNPDYNPKVYTTNTTNPVLLNPTLDALIAACCAVSLSVSALACLIYISGNNRISRRFVGTIVEALISLLLAVIWICANFVIMNPHNGLAIMEVDAVNGEKVIPWRLVINDANLYFSSWGAVICAGINFGMYMSEWQSTVREWVMSRVKISITPSGMGIGYTIRWSLLALASGVVLVMSVDKKDIVCCPWHKTMQFIPNGAEQSYHCSALREEDPYDTCSRNSFGIVTGKIIH